MSRLVRDFSFQGQLSWSTGVAVDSAIENILLNNIPGSIAVGRAAEGEDRSGVDYWVYRAALHPIGVDLKRREDDPLTFRIPKDDLALEVWSSVERKKLGWTRDETKRTDYILWHFVPTGRWVLVPFPMLCAVFIENFDLWTDGRYQQATQSSNGMRWHSSCVYVPRKVLWRALYNRYAGDASIPPNQL